MIYTYINSVDRTEDVTQNTLRIVNQIQRRTDSANFNIFRNTKPSENQDTKIYDGAIVLSHSGTTIILKESFDENVDKFRAGQVIWLDLNSALEKATISTYTSSTRTIILTEAPDVSMSEDDLIGELIFGGTVSRVQDQNDELLSVIQYNIVCTDYSKIFDKKIIADTWEDVDSRHIINDFCNTTVNFNSTLDDISYANTTALRAEWIESSDGGNPTADLSDFLESISSGVFPWTNSSGTAIWTGSPTSKDLSQLFGATSGQPTKGFNMGWFKTSDQSSITSLVVRIGSSAGAYADFTIDLTASTDWQYVKSRGINASVTGVPDWTVTNYAQLRVVQTGNGQVKWNGLRINDDSSFTLFNVQSTNDFNDFRSPQLKPTDLMNQLTKAWEFVYYIDYERDIHFVEKENDPAPFSITDTSNNFTDLKIGVDTSNLGNRIIIKGGEKTSDSTYAQIFEGDGVLREWVLKNKFNNLVITIDDGSSTDLTEGGTTTTSIVATSHGLVVGDHIVNRTRSNAVRQILTVPDPNTFTVEAVTGQVSGDTFSKFDTTKTGGIEGIVDETTVDYVYNSNAQSVRATESEATLTSSNFIRFAYNERLQIQIQYTDSASANALKALGGLGDGIFDLDPMVDRNIQDNTIAVAIAQARVSEYSNPIINGTFKTDQRGLKAGQLLTITETVNRNIDDTYVIQIIKATQKDGRFKDYIIYDVTFGTTLFGWIEFMQKLLKIKDGLELNTDSIVETFATSDEIVEISESNTATLGGIKTATENETVECSEVNTVIDFTPPFKWETSTGQPFTTRWNLFSWS